MLTESQKQELQAKHLHQTLARKGFIDEEVSYQLDYWHAVFTEINSRYEKAINTSKQLGEIISQAQQERTKILNEKKELKQQIQKLKEEKEKSLYEINDLESDLDISNEIIISKNGTIKGLVDKSNKQNQAINKLQDYQSYLAKKKKKNNETMPAKSW